MIQISLCINHIFTALFTERLCTKIVKKNALLCLPFGGFIFYCAEPPVFCTARGYDAWIDPVPIIVASWIYFNTSRLAEPSSCFAATSVLLMQPNIIDDGPALVDDSNSSSHESSPVDDPSDELIQIMAGFS
jgi:hypothetical protein